jgi:hypothetical protein
MRNGFEKALGWNPQEEPAANGLALARWNLGDEAGAKQVQMAWAGRSERTSTVGRGYSYLGLRHYSDADQVFRAAAAAGNRDAIHGLNDVCSALEPRGSMN